MRGTRTPKSIRIETLGDLRVVVDDREIPELPGQGIRCGLLVHLAIEGQALRDTLLPLFWPERAPERARHSLSQTLYELSGALGSEDWLERRVDRLVVGNGIETDVAAFEAAVRAQDWDTALRTYRGPFLEGHRLGSTADFEHWTEAVAARLDLSFRAASRERVRWLIEQGRSEEALPIARNWVRSNPLSEEAELAVLDTLARTGRRAEAIRHFESYRRYHDEELGTPPSARLIEMADRIRSGSPSPSGVAPEPPVRVAGMPPPDAVKELDPRRVVVLPFENLSPDPENEYFADGISETIASRLVSHPGLSVVPRTSVARVRIGEVRIREVGREFGAGTIVQGTVQKAGHRVRVSASLVDARSEATRWSETYDGTLNQVFEIQSEVASGIAGALGRSTRGPIGRPGDIDPTRSPEAYDLYLRGRYLAAVPEADSMQQGLRFLERAVEKDPTFALALSRISDTYEKLRLQSRLSNFRGRESELAVLESAAARALSGEGSLVTISGPPGIGKSSLFFRFRQGVDALEASVHHTRCKPHRTSAPFLPLAAVLRDALRLPETPSRGLADLAEDKLRHLNPGLLEDGGAHLYLLGMGAGTRAARLEGERLRAAADRTIVEMARALSLERPRIFFLDDWQWSDEASHEAVLALASRVSELPVLLLVGYRSYYEPEWRGLPHTEIQLGPLGATEVEGMVGSLLGETRLGPEMASRLLSSTNGNPFHIEEACRALQDSGAGMAAARRPGLPDGGWRDALPSTLEAVLRSRFARLERSDAEALELAAVLGAELSLQLLSQISDAPEALPQALQRLEALELIRAIPNTEEPSFEFQHDITLDAARKAVPIGRSRALHRRAATAIEALHSDEEAESVVEELAFHYAESGDVPNALRYLERAGDKAMRAFSLAEARRHYRRAIDLLDEQRLADERRIDLSFKLTEASIQSASSELVSLLERSRAAAVDLDDRVRETRALYWLGWAHYALGNQLDAQRHFRECLDMLLGESDERLLAQVYLNIGYSYAAATDYDEALDFFRKGRQRRPITAGKASQGLAYALGYEAMIFGDRGDFEKAEEKLQEGLRQVDALGQKSVEGSVRTQEGMLRFFRGDWSACRSMVAEIRRVGAEIGSRYIDAVSRTLEGYARFVEGEREPGLELLQEAVDLLEQSGAHLVMSWNRACLAEALAIAGRVEEAERVAALALERGKVHDRLGEPSARRALARIAALHDPPDWGFFEEHIEAALKCSEKKDSDREAAITHLTAAEILAQHGRAEAASDHLRQCRAGFEALGMPWYLTAAGKVAETVAARGP